MQKLDESLFARVTALSRQSPRLRQNYNLHQDYSEPCQRLLNALQPGTYVRPHRHLNPPRPECFIALRGRMAVVLFNDHGEIKEVVEFAPAGPVHGLDVPAGSWHALVALEPDSLFFECKPGPYEPLSDKDWAPWAPAEGGAAAKHYQLELEKAVLAHRAK